MPIPLHHVVTDVTACIFSIPDSGIWYDPRVLDSVDVYVLLKVASVPDGVRWIQSGLAHEIGVSPSVVNRSLKKAEDLKLYHPIRRKANSRALTDALVHGARYFLAPKRGGEVRGVPTAWAAPPLDNQLVSGEALPPVWPDPEGIIRGLSVEPLHPSAPQAARRNAAFYELLALVDVLRIGGTRERSLAEKELSRLLSSREQD